MSDILFLLLAAITCLGVPVALVVALIVWLSKRKAAPPAPVPGDRPVLDVVEEYVRSRFDAGRLPLMAASQIHALITEDRALLQGAPLPAATPAPVSAQAAVTAVAASAAATASTPPVISAPAAPPQPTLPATPPQPSRGNQLLRAVLALRTRQTLLLLGAFLIVVSSLILVVFNWASFPPIAQFGLLAGVCGAFWGGGHLLTRRWSMAQAGAGLQLVGGVLVPVVAFSLSRPGLLDTAPRAAWLLASALSLPIYALAAWRLRRAVFAGAGCLAAASALLAALSSVPDAWLPTALILTLASFLPLAQWLTRRAPALAAGPLYVAHVGLPATLLGALALGAGNLIGAWPLAGALWAGAASYGLALALYRQPRWSWATAALGLAALVASLLAADASPLGWSVALATAALLYLALGVALEPRARAHALPLYSGAALAWLATLPFFTDPAAARAALPLLIVASWMLAAAYHRGRFAWLDINLRLGLATLGLGIGGMLLPLWLLALLDLTAWSTAQQGLALLPLAALAFVAARWWPGRLRRPYDITLQVLGGLIALVAGVRLLDGAGLLPAAGWAALAAVLTFQTVLRRREWWAAAALGSALLALGLFVNQQPFGNNIAVWLALGVGVSALYGLGGTVLRGGQWRCWTWPALGWCVLVSSATLLLLAIDAATEPFAQTRHMLTLSGLALTGALLQALWRRAWLGFVVAPLLAATALLAVNRSFVADWQLFAPAYGYALCGITTALALLGQMLRRAHPRFANPYEIVGFALLTFAPLMVLGNPRDACLIWATLALLYALASWRYRLPLLVAPALLAGDVALLAGAAWLAPTTAVATWGLLLLAATAAQVLLGLFVPRPVPADLWEKVRIAAFGAALLSGTGALLLAGGSDPRRTLVLLSLAALLGLVATLRQNPGAAWGTLGLLAAGLASWHDLLGLSLEWSMAWGVAEALAISMLGWLIERAARPHGAVWMLPLRRGPLAAGLLLPLALLVIAPFTGLPPLTFALATLGLLLATQAVRERNLLYAYGAGAALIAASGCQLYDWGFRQPQWYAVPSGLYLLALAEGLRRFQGQRQLSQLVEAGAATLLLGVTLGQSLRADGITSQLYAAALCAEALAMLGYGVLRKLRVPFAGGAVFFVLGVAWLSVDPLLAANKWMLLGILGMLMVAAYLVLERRQEQLLRSGRAWVEQISRWA